MSNLTFLRTSFFRVGRPFIHGHYFRHTTVQDFSVFTTIRNALFFRTQNPSLILEQPSSLLTKRLPFTEQSSTEASTSKSLRFVLGAVSLCTVGYCCMQRTPGGYVLLVENWHGQVGSEIYEEYSVVPFIPIYQKPVLIRLIPVRKRMKVLATTKDDKEIEVVVQAQMQPKIAFCKAIYMRFGTDYARGFLSKEATVDVEEVVKHYAQQELLAEDEAANEASETAVDEMVERLSDAAIFNKIVLTDVSVIFRDPDVP